MSKLIYSMLASLDGYVSDSRGDFGWAAPDAELHTFVNDQSRSIGTFLYGRRMYETMVFWETAHTHPGAPPFIVEFARLWQAADKRIYSTQLAEVRSQRTRIERRFDAGALRTLKATSERDLAIAGPQLAAQALRAGLVDELQLYLAPAIVGGGNRLLPDDLRLDLTLLDERRFGTGFVYLRYGVRPAPAP